MTTNFTDTLIIGGGLAGLHSAYQLFQMGQDCALLEAKSQLGGRIVSAEGDKPDVGYDLGPTWFWPHQHALLSLLDRLALPYFEQYSQGDVLYQLQADQAPTQVGGNDNLLSYRLEGGMQRLTDKLASTIPESAIHLNTVVTLVERREEHWRVEASRNGTLVVYQANNLIMAMPPRIIARACDPGQWASPHLQSALTSQQTWMAGQAKFVAAYEQPFWRDKGFSGTAFSRVGPMQQISDASATDDSHFALFGFVGIQAQMREQIGAEQLKQACLNQLAKLFGDEARLATHVFLKDWAEDDRVATVADSREQTRHAYVPMQQFAQELNQLQLGLAGSEFAAQEAGYLEGAILASQAAVDRIIQKQTRVSA